jgi:hypothetical protein
VQQNMTKLTKKYDGTCCVFGGIIGGFEAQN